ncbi:MAG: hypothetical protein GKR91_19000 [Pseudomonadales bacterium]|nr:hypothetical protein [Pseudomonadales bacterium]
MTIRASSVFLASILAMPLFLLAAEDEGWELKRDRDGIQVYTRPVEGSPYDAVRSVTIMDNVRLASLVALIQDAPACEDWADRCDRSFVHEEISEFEVFVYTNNDMPFPVADRDVLAHVIWQQDPQSLIVQMNSEATTGRLDEIRGRSRLTDAKANWTFKPLADGRVEISNEAHIDPGSPLPGWITNMLLVDTPFVTMQAFIQEVTKPEYRDAEVGFVSEPN